MRLIMDGYSSAYSIWSFMKRESKIKGDDTSDVGKKILSYKNVGRRVIKLLKAGLLEEVKIGESIHGRKDYKLTIKGIKYMIPYILNHPEEIQRTAQYMDKFGLDRKSVGRLLLNEIDRMVDELDNLHALAIATDQYEYLPMFLERFDQIRSQREDIERKFSRYSKKAVKKKY